MKLLIGFYIFIASLCVASESTTNLSVLTYNTWMLPVQRKMADERAQAIGREIRKYDLIFLQEAFSKRLRDKIADYAGRDVFDNRYKPVTSLKLNSGKFTFSKFKITGAKFHRFKACGGIQCLSEKGVLYVQIKLNNGRVIDTFNTHLQAYEKYPEIRKRQLIESINFINGINDGEVPVIFAGDFNVVSELDEYNIFYELMPEFRDVWMDTNSNFPGHTWNPDINPWANYDENETKQFQRIDYIFIRDGHDDVWDIVSSEVVFDEKVIWYDIFQRKKYIFASDHFGVHSKLALRH